MRTTRLPKFPCIAIASRTPKRSRKCRAAFRRRRSTSTIAISKSCSSTPRPSNFFLHETISAKSSCAADMALEDELRHRHERLGQIRSLGYLPYGHPFEQSHSIAEIVTAYGSKTAEELAEPV